MKMAVFWDVAPCSLVEVYQLSNVLAASIIRAMSEAATLITYLGSKDLYNHRLYLQPTR
jgi:hypothetical protein